ncbi:unnamed protein product [Linum trigynum]|uniref:DUF4378 domain-containing protein n=1 Tax=Linum trigynum TaxID=586398 RepID=A0AAV2GMR2_9ROSI
MAAKLLHSLADDNPDLQKQIGCMTGIFQIFDRQQMLTGRRLSHKKLPPGESHLVRGSSDRESFDTYRRRPLDTSLNKCSNEKQRMSTESSRASFSSSCSSLSSLENRTAQPETSSTDRIIFPETPSRDPVLTHQPSTCSYSERHSVDLREVVKDSMYRDARGLSVKTMSKQEAKGSSDVKHKDSPRPLLHTKSAADGSYGVATINKVKQNVPVDHVHDSLRALAKIREAPWYHNETREHARPSSYESKDVWSTATKDAPRFSYDGRDSNRLSFESRDSIRATSPKLKELPRLSLDSRERSMKAASMADSKRSSYLSRDLQHMSNSDERVYNAQKQSGNPNRPPSVVAKLMGLEMLPDSASSSQSAGSLKTTIGEHTDAFSRSFKQNDANLGIRIPKSPRSMAKEPVLSPRRKNPDHLIMRPISKLPIEPAPWKQMDGMRGAQKSSFKSGKTFPTNTQNSFPSVYSEIEKRLKDLEFKQSGKDLRALKQILEAMQAKGLLETGKVEEQNSKFGTTQADFDPRNATTQSPSRLSRQENLASTSTAAKASNSLRTYESPIVIMKPAKLVEKSGIPSSSVIPIDGLPGFHRIHNGGYAISSRVIKDQSPRNTHRESVSYSGDKITSGSRGIRSNQTSKPQQRESTSSYVKSTGSVSPRLQQKKLELERRSRPPTPPSDITSKPRRRQQSGRQPPPESGSPGGGKHRIRSPKQAQNDDQLSQISNESRTSSYQADDIMSMQSDHTVTVFDLKTDFEVTSADRSCEIQSPPLKASTTSYVVSYPMLHSKETSNSDEEVAGVELVVAPEQPSPVSVLDSSAYKDAAISPVKQAPSTPGGGGAQNSTDSQNGNPWNSSESLSNNCTGSGLLSDINRKKLKNIENLVQKLRRLNSTHDEASTDYIASLCDNSDPDHRYISEILLASGLLLRDLGSGLTTFQLHPSGHPINPELFCVLEQTKASNLQMKEQSSGPMKAEKSHRKLIFDAVNETLVKKLALVSVEPEPWLKSGKLARKTTTAQKLLKELCLEIEQLQVKKLEECSLEDEEDGLKVILCEDMTRRSDSWTEFDNEVSGLVLDVERLIFKDLVDEIVMGEAVGGPRTTKLGRRRQLFAK